MPYAALRDAKPGRDTASLAADVAAARAAQLRRFEGAARTNATITPGELRRHCALARPAEDVLEQACSAGRLSARGVGRIQRVARTIADLAGAAQIERDHVLEALRWRMDVGK